MPLSQGSGSKTISGNIKEMMDSYNETGKIGNTTPRNSAHALKIAEAAAYSKAGKSRGK